MLQSSRIITLTQLIVLILTPLLMTPSPITATTVSTTLTALKTLKALTALKILSLKEKEVPHQHTLCVNTIYICVTYPIIIKYVTHNIPLLLHYYTKGILHT